MSASDSNILETKQPNSECRSLNASTASARRASPNGTCATTGNYGLLSRMYPGLSREQAAAMIRQRIMLEELRRAATSPKSHR